MYRFSVKRFCTRELFSAKHSAIIRDLFISLILLSCNQKPNKQQSQDNEQNVSASMHGIEIPCMLADTFRYAKNKEKLLEKLLDVYIENEAINGNEYFIEVNSHCWTDSTYLVNFSHYKWFDHADSLIFLESSKNSSYKGFSIYLNIINSVLNDFISSNILHLRPF